MIGSHQGNQACKFIKRFIESQILKICIFIKITIMGFALSNKSIDKYFGFLTKLDKDSKKKLIIKLTESIENQNKKMDFKSLFGAWEDDKDSDEIIKQIRASRLDNQNLAEF